MRDEPYLVSLAAVINTDQALIDEMVAGLGKNEGKVSAAVQAIVRSPQFRMIRGRDDESRASGGPP